MEGDIYVVSLMELQEVVHKRLDFGFPAVLGIYSLGSKVTKVLVEVHLAL
jgi:hypothetical protein